jgi:hypothetical protein
VDGQYIVGDVAYGSVSDRDLPEDKDTYNYFQSAHRTCVERAFGGLVARWGVLWKPLRTSSLERQIAIIGACVRLHNLATDVAEQHRPYVPSRAATVPRRKWRANRRTAAAKRAAVTGRLQRAGLRRPPLPQHE